MATKTVYYVQKVKLIFPEGKLKDAIKYFRDNDDYSAVYSSIGYEKSKNKPKVYLNNPQPTNTHIN